MMQRRVNENLQSEKHEKIINLGNQLSPEMPWNIQENTFVDVQNSFSDTVSQDVTGETQYDADPLDVLDDLNFVDLYATNYPDQHFEEFFKELLSSTKEVWASSQTQDVVQPVESNDAVYRIDRSDDQSKMIENNVLKLPITRSSTEQTANNETTEAAIPLSDSVLVTLPSPSQLLLVHPLEETYRPRYKSDYFPQKGPVRRPRYVADKVGNHYVTIQIPLDHRSDLTEKFLRIALITTNIDGRGYFYSPYKFQTDNENANVTDQNPIYLPVETNPHQDYKMKLHLVLIKSKLDQLRLVQPLQPFAYPSNAVQNLINNEHLTPKELINRYQLEKSHVAFTLCTKLPDGSYALHSDTTVLSSIITEATAQPTAKTSSPSETKKICCPNCSHTFAIREISSTSDADKKRKTTKKNSEEIGEESTVVEKPAKKRRKKTDA